MSVLATLIGLFTAFAAWLLRPTLSAGDAEGFWDFPGEGTDAEAALG
ncbi:hypothetical protein [Deinococcus pimensis]|nr:hypothetical protein [Deinococcus pimensis]